MEAVINKGKHFLLILGFSVILSCNAFAIEFPGQAVSKKILDNGLTVLAKNAPPDNLVSIDIKISAGSSLEEEYLGSGISHLVEHMVFKGTSTRGAGDIERDVKSYGGLINAAVNQDLTDFHIIVPVEYFNQALALLKDMLLNAKFDMTELESEKAVILKEMKFDEDEPQSRLMRLLNESAYLRHTYKYPPIGYETKFKSLTRDDVVKYYNRMYAPNRIVIAVVGGVVPNEAISKVENEFKDFRPSDYRSIGLSPAEPAQIDRREANKEDEINLAYLAVGFHSTGVLNEDLFAMDVLSMILGRGDNSRLNTRLFKDKKLVHSISCWNYTPRDPGLFVITAILDKDKAISCEGAIFEEIKKIQARGVDQKELESARRMVASDYIFSHETIDQQANDLAANYILTGSYDFYRRYVEGIENVSDDDVKRVANIYLSPEKATVAKLVPKGTEVSGQIPSAEKSKAAQIKKVLLPNGLTILVREDNKTPTISISVAMLGGLMAEGKKNNGISNLTAAMLLRGTNKRKEPEIKGAIESMGGGVNSFSSFNSFGVNMHLLKPDLEACLNILKDILTESAFPEEELHKEKILALAGLKEEGDDIFHRGLDALRSDIFENSPYSFKSLGSEESIKALDRQSLINFYKTYCVPNNMVISISGDVESGSLIDNLKATFADLKRSELPVFHTRSARLDKLKARSLRMDRGESLVMIGFETTSMKDNDKYALDVLTSVLSGYSGRLFMSIRDKLSLSYTLGCVQRLALDTGYLVFYAATTKENVAEVKRVLQNEISDIRQNEAGQDELALAKRELVTKYAIAAQTNAFYSSAAALDELYGLGYDEIYKYEKGIDKVTGEDLKRVAYKYLDTNACAEIIISP